MISFSTIITTLFFSTLYILFLALISRNEKLYFKFGLKKLILLSLLMLLHIFVPATLPAITHNLHFNRVWPEINRFLYTPHTVFMGVKITIMRFLSLLWISGSILCTARLARSYIRHHKLLSGYERVKDEAFQKMITEINSTYRRKKSFTVVFGKADTTPYLFGIFRPCIVIPKIELSLEEWQFIFRHEMAHFYQGDLLVRFFLNFAHAIYWWNPVINIFRNQFVKLQEINTDFNVISNLDNRNKLKYMECLSHLALLQLENETSASSMASFHYSGISTVTRIQLMYESFEQPLHPKKRDAVFIALLFLFALILPYVVSLEPHGIYLPDAPDAFLVKKSDYFIQRSDGTYDFYLDGEYTCNVDFIFDDMPEVYYYTE